MSTLVFFKLVAIFVVVALGWVVGKAGWLGQNDPARTLANAAYYIFVPALLFRTTARIDLQAMPWGTVIAFFVPVLTLLIGVYLWERRANRHGSLPAAAPSVRAISATFGNSVQVGIPFAAALFGEAGLAIHVALVSLHAMTLLTVLTALVELDLARARRTAGHSNAHLLKTLGRTLRNTIVHPVVLPVIAGLAWNLAGLPLPTVADEILATLAQAVVPLCLVLIGMSLAYYGVKGAARGAVVISVLKLMVLPAMVLAMAHWGFGLSGLPLAVVVMMAALPVGSNALIFSQRYETLEAEATAAIVFSTLGFVMTASVWLAVLAWLG
ncbi:AEC family transporter [Rhizobacter sp. AJA081-3]|uniref:AEC family transporter n=1 Tax=Rhizobacter sp. AJA081-3 TaxID=2753607 RepID=UPI001AE01D56|nr:AEC family transporter [Rhizobacter sp. AJA081-3]QTN22692.1 AEC family transporter [Rhizobacter sp. AJA081-3]